MLVPDGTPEQYKWMDDAQVAAASPADAERFFRIQCDSDLTGELANIEAPTLVFHGTRETGVPFSEAEYAAQRIPRARLVPLPTQNHLLIPDEPAWGLFLKEVDGFIADLAR
jgi:pimeloyl-ACP methyl ester carboxylesterase